jgi:trehalose 6-phosphate synthase
VSGRSSFVVVANRLPVDRVTTDGGATRWVTSPGGLVSALEPLLESQPATWIGWAGQPGPAPRAFRRRKLTLKPVALSAGEIDRFYEGFSNGTLWPLFHDAGERPAFHRSWWDEYVVVNRRFAEAAAAAADDGATVWVHDYQLMLVPGMLRAMRPDLRIGFFLHIPFPPEELFCQLPWRKDIVAGLLGADVVGFQRPLGAQNFLRLTRRLLGCSPKRGGVEYDGRQVHVGAFPISIDASSYDAVARRPEVQERTLGIRRELGWPRTILLGVDRLDYTKGIEVRLRAFRELLEDGALTTPEVVMVQVAVPTRDNAAHYAELRERVERQVGQINGDWGSMGLPAIHYLHQSVARDELVALYRAADVMLVTPLRDGMNLVAKEFVTARRDLGGVLVLSEFCGAADELKHALLVNPHDIDGVKDAILRAIAVDRRESARWMHGMRRQVMRHDVRAWARSFLGTLGVSLA